MEAQEILAQAKASQEPPADWVVFPILRQNLIVGIASWLFGMLFGLGMLAALVPFVIPNNYQYGPTAATITTIVLGILLFIGLSSIWMLIVDVRRLMQMNKHLIVITPQDFVKQEGDKLIHIPLIHVCYLTARGLSRMDSDAAQTDSARESPNQKGSLLGLFSGRGLIPSAERWRRRRMRTTTTVAFLDTRTNQKVLVLNDEMYGDPLRIASILQEYTEGAQQVVR